MVGQALATAGWARFGPDPALRRWAAAARPLALQAIAISTEAWRCGGTWFVGVDALANDAHGAVGGIPLRGLAAQAVADQFGPQDFHRAQLSATRPGYPQPSADETDAAYRYRLNRDAAHIDGILPIGPNRRRMIREPHGFVLGIPLTESDPGAAPLVVWEGSQNIIAQAFRATLAPHDPAQWSEVDVTDAYHAARAQVFDTCPRRILHASPGEAILLHRHLLHGVSSWAAGATAPPDGRIIAYFRPQLASVSDWLDA